MKLFKDIEDKSKKLQKKRSFNPTEASEKRLIELADMRGVSYTDIINQCILSIPVIQIGDIEELGKEFCRLRVALENNNLSDEDRKRGEDICAYMLDLIHHIEVLSM